MVWIWGIHTVAAALEKRAHCVKRIWITSQNKQKIDELLSKCEAKNCHKVHTKLLNCIEKISHEKMDQKFGKNHQGIAIEIEQINFWNLNDWLAKQSNSSLLIACDLIEDPHNLGAIIRTAAAFKAGGVLITQDKQAPFEGALAKAAAGGIEFIPIIKVSNLSNALNVLKKNYYMIYGLDETGLTDWSDIVPRHKVNKSVLIAGQEGKGLRRLTKENCDMLLAIDTNKEFPTLNVSVATGVTISRFAQYL